MNGLSINMIQIYPLDYGLSVTVAYIFSIKSV